NFHKISVLGEVFSLYDFFSILHIGLLFQYLHFIDKIILSLFFILFVKIVFLMKKPRKSKKTRKKKILKNNPGLKAGVKTLGRAPLPQGTHPALKGEVSLCSTMDPTRYRFNPLMGVSLFVILCLSFAQELHLEGLLTSLKLTNALWNP